MYVTIILSHVKEFSMSELERKFLEQEASTARLEANYLKLQYEVIQNQAIVEKQCRELAILCAGIREALLILDEADIGSAITTLMALLPEGDFK
jgi:prephenate dehydrogenase